MPFVPTAFLPGPSFPGPLNGTAGASSPRIWHYSTPDNRATVTASGYFNGSAKFIAKGDVILAMILTSATPALTILVVTSETAAATVTTTQLTLS